MPKRRTPKQRAASRRNLKLARAVKARQKPMGKIALLYHRTSPANASSIVKHGFDSSKALKGKLTRARAEKNVFFSDKPHGDAKRHGSALLSVKVPRKSIKRDPNFDTYKGETFYVVPQKALAGKKIRRH